MVFATASSASAPPKENGTPDQVAERIAALRDDLGLDGVLIELNCGGKVEHAHEMEAMRLLCEVVMPRFR